MQTPAKPVANNNNNNNNKRPAAQPAKAKAAPLKKKPRRVDGVPCYGALIGMSQTADKRDHIQLPACMLQEVSRV